MRYYILCFIANENKQFSQWVVDKWLLDTIQMTFGCDTPFSTCVCAFVSNENNVIETIQRWLCADAGNPINCVYF